MYVSGLNNLNDTREYIQVKRHSNVTYMQHIYSSIYLNNHQKIHTGERPLQCHVCKQKRTYPALKWHWFLSLTMDWRHLWQNSVFLGPVLYCKTTGGGPVAMTINYGHCYNICIDFYPVKIKSIFCTLSFQVFLGIGEDTWCWLKGKKIARKYDFGGILNDSSKHHKLYRIALVKWILINTSVLCL